jgi:hypothetical protein
MGLACSFSAKWQIWEDFCIEHAVGGRDIPLFAQAGDGSVTTARYGRDQRLLLTRAPEMEAMVIETVDKVLATPAADGMLYIMYRRGEGGSVVPLYIGKAGRYGRAGNRISANLAGIRTNGGKFARWGSNYAYHIGDLSAAVLPGHDPRKVVLKYQRWAARLFESAPSATPTLRFPVRFWCTAWQPEMRGIWPEFGSCPLAFMEYLLIGVAGLLFPDDLLNDEGVNRGVANMMDER